MVICAVRARNFGGGDGGAVDRDEPGFGGFAAAFALADRGIETVKDFARQQAAQLAAVALGKSGDDHLVGGARAGDEVLGVEVGSAAAMASSPAAAADPVSATPFQRSAAAGATSTGRVGAGFRAGRGGKVTTLSVAGLRTARGPNTGRRAAARGRCAAPRRCEAAGK